MIKYMLVLCDFIKIDILVQVFHILIESIKVVSIYGIVCTEDFSF